LLNFSLTISFGGGVELNKGTKLLKRQKYMRGNREGTSEGLAEENKKLIKEEEGTQSFDKELEGRSVLKYISPMYYMERGMAKNWRKEERVKREDLLARVKEHGAEIQEEALNYVEARKVYEGLLEKLQNETGAQPATQGMNGFIESMDGLSRMQPDVPEGSSPEQAEEAKKAAAIEKGQVLAAMDFFTPKVGENPDGTVKGYNGYEAQWGGSRLPRLDLGADLPQALEAVRANNGKLLRLSVNQRSKYSSEPEHVEKFIPLTAETADLLAEKAGRALKGGTQLYHRSKAGARYGTNDYVDYECEVFSPEDAEKQLHPQTAVLRYDVVNGKRKTSHEFSITDGDPDRLKQKVLGHIHDLEMGPGSGMDVVQGAKVRVGETEVPFEEFMRS